MGWWAFASSELVHMRLFIFSLREWRHERDFHIEDAYKWLFHATLGGEHAVTSEEGPRAWLDDEWKTLGPPHEFEQITTALRPDRAIMRLNLRPYKARHGDKELLLKAFVAGARKFKKNKTEFIGIWQFLGANLKEVDPLGGLTHQEWLRLDRIAKENGYPAIDHSAAYEKANAPAYRVLTKKQAQKLLMRLDR